MPPTPADHDTHDDHDHQHGPACGHETMPHGDHVDYLHDGHRHRDHDGHWDECAVADGGTRPIDHAIGAE